MASSQLKVLIVGAGLGGLTLGLLLEQAGVPYTILEKHAGDLLPLGSSISLNQTIQPLFEQLGMLTELEAISKPIGSMTFLKESMNKIGSLDLYSDSVRIAWRVTYNLPTTQIRQEHHIRSSDWGPAQVEEMANACRDFICPYGSTLADVIDKTPKDRMSKVLLEEKGAAQAMLDAVSLANLLHEIPSTSTQDIQGTFEAYYKERVSMGKAAVQGSRHMGRLSGGHKWTETVIRSMFLNILPSKVQQTILDKMLHHRPQATFLPFVPDRGEFKAKPQVQSKRIRSLSGLCLRLFKESP
ncbi:hypothetical protein EC968_002680 [Mortierella alpina]|nr:hypothetical protein EC968_002680 [Mortierella alpina]